MRLRARLSLNSVIILITLLVMMLALYGSYLETSRANRNRVLAAKMQQVAFERTVLRDEYLLTGSERSTAEWKAETAGFEELLSQAEEAFESPGDRAILREIRTHFEQTASIYPQLVKIRGSGALPQQASSSKVPSPREQALLGEILLNASLLTERISSLRDAARNSWQDAYNRWIAFFFIFTGAAAAMIIVNSVFINRLLARRIGTLREAMGRITAGLFDQPLPLEGHDELTDLARATNEMAAHLKNSYTSIETLQREVAERKHAEESLRLAEERYRNIFDHAVEGIFQSTPEGRFIQVNPAYARIFGYDSPEEMIASITDIGRQVYVDPEERRQALEILSRDGLLHDFGCRARRKDGTVIWISIDSRYGKTPEGTPCYEGFVSDISTRKKAEEAIRESERHLSELIEFLPDATLVIDREGKVVAWNRAIEAMTGVRARDMLGRGDHEYALPFYGERRPILIDLALHWDPEMEKRYTELRKKGDILIGESYVTNLPSGHAHLSATASVLRNAKGEIVAAIECIRDDTERRSLAEERDRSVERIRRTLGATVQAMAAAIEARDPYTSGHQRRVADLARSVAREMGLPAEQIDGIRVAGIIHDVGKMSVPSSILSKPTRLTEVEFELVRTHAEAGYEILKDLDFPWPVATIARQHHERMKGSGYPRGLLGDEILIEARILAVADVVEAMASHRPYRPTLGVDKALEEITAGRETLYDPEVVDACVRLFREKGYNLP
jgi:PAS domain S-box-containing protein/putative nucleotidyltransferase with HDIG domain